MKQVEIATVTKEQFTSLCNLGFNWFSCSCGGFPDCICESTNPKPTVELVLKWLREQKSINVFVVPCYSFTWKTMLSLDGKKLKYPKKNVLEFPMTEHKTYEETQLSGIDAAISYLKNKMS